jgi:hypothetical protein
MLAQIMLPTIIWNLQTDQLLSSEKPDEAYR